MRWLIQMKGKIQTRGDAVRSQSRLLVVEQCLPVWRVAMAGGDIARRLGGLSQLTVRVFVRGRPRKMASTRVSEGPHACAWCDWNPPSRLSGSLPTADLQT